VNYFPLFTGKFTVVCADDIARFCPDDDIRAHYADADLFALARLADRFRIITD